MTARRSVGCLDLGGCSAQLAVNQTHLSALLLLLLAAANTPAADPLLEAMNCSNSSTEERSKVVKMQLLFAI